MPIRSRSRKKVHKFALQRDECLITNINGISKLYPDDWLDIYGPTSAILPLAYNSKAY